MDCQLAEIERKCGVKRWSRTDPEYVETKQATITEKLKQLQGCLWASVVKRYYLLQMKAKYAGLFMELILVYVAKPGLQMDRRLPKSWGQVLAKRAQR